MQFACVWPAEIASIFDSITVLALELGFSICFVRAHVQTCSFGDCKLHTHRNVESTRRTWNNVRAAIGDLHQFAQNFMAYVQRYVEL